MIRISFKEPRTVAWKNWRRRSEAAQAALDLEYASGRVGKISNKLYREQKELYLGLNGPFHGKCAYCESLIAANHPGDIDHFRPKNGVTVDSLIITVNDGKKRSVPHPGYYWLAYNYRNLLPACEDCNRPNKGKSGGLLIGKWNNFPVKGFRAEHPGDEKKERPLLINPVTAGRMIEQHLTFNAQGVVEYWTTEGKTCCDVFGLNIRQALVQERMEAYQRGYDAVLNYLVALGNDNASGANIHLRTINEYEAGIRPYSAAGRAGIDAKCKKIGRGKYRVTARRISRK